MKNYVMSDIHGHLEIFKNNLKKIDLEDKNNKLILLGDYLDRHNYEDISVLEEIKKLQDKYKAQVIALMGNHELYFLEEIENKVVTIKDERIVSFVKNLPYYYETTNQIYVHAGIEEEAGEYWKIGVEDYSFCCKYPHTIGKFHKDVIAGHIGTEIITGIKDYADIYFDGKSHYYIDGTTEKSKVIPILIYDDIKKTYSKYEEDKEVIINIKKEN